MPWEHLWFRISCVTNPVYQIVEPSLNCLSVKWAEQRVLSRHKSFVSETLALRGMRCKQGHVLSLEYRTGLYCAIHSLFLIVTVFGLCLNSSQPSKALNALPLALDWISSLSYMSVLVKNPLR